MLVIFLGISVALGALIVAGLLRAAGLTTPVPDEEVVEEPDVSAVERRRKVA